MSIFKKLKFKLLTFIVWLLCPVFKLRFFLITTRRASLLDRLISLIPFHCNNLTIHHPGIREPLFLRANTSDIFIYLQILQRYEFDFPYRDSIKTIIDAGANIGLCSIYFANLYPNATIISIEPDTKNFQQLLKNISNYENIIPIKAALWNYSGTINLFDPGWGSWGYQTSNEFDNVKKDLIGIVQAITIEEILKNYKLDKIDLLKIDIEGAEYEVFSNADNWLDSVDAIVIELHERLREDSSKIFWDKTKKFKNRMLKGELIYLFR